MLRRTILSLALLAGPGPAMSKTLVDIPAGKRDFADWMREGAWRSKRDQPRGWMIRDGELRLYSAANSVLIGTEKGFPVDLGPTPKLRLRLKVKTVPRGTDLSRKSGDDAAFRAYLAFDKGGGALRPPNTIAYTWTEKEAAGTMIRSAHFSNLFYISIGSGTATRDWSVVERDLAADYRRAFPNDTAVPHLKGLLLKCDSNDTKTSAEASLASIELTAKENRP